jgi:hypothetical protein
MSTTSKTISEECSVIAFYGIEPNVQVAERLYHTMVEWFTDLGYPPDKVGITGPGHSNKVVSFSRGNAKLLKRGFEGVTDFELLSTISETLRVQHNYHLTAIYNGRAKRLYALVVARSALATLSPTSMLPIARVMAQELKPGYGIGYRREHRRGPEFYVFGICRGLGFGGYGVNLSEAEREEASSISRWSNAMDEQVWREGTLRDVYPWNFLNVRQLNMEVQGRSLRDWIKQDPRRGSLAAVSDAIALWDVPDVSIPEIRRQLKDAHLLFDWRRYT